MGSVDRFLFVQLEAQVPAGEADLKEAVSSILLIKVRLKKVGSRETITPEPDELTCHGMPDPVNVRKDAAILLFTVMKEEADQSTMGRVDQVSD